MVITHQRAQRMTSSMAFQGPSFSSLYLSSSPIRSWNHDVFLSFRGKDVRQNFISHLYQALYQRGINTYIDNNLERGNEIWPELSNAIEGSMISIIIFSKNYAESRWCLNELLKILDCKEKMKQFVLPIFYNVDPSEVQHQKEDFGKAFTKLLERIKDNVKVLEWKVALKKVADLSGFSLASFRNESELIHTIIQWVDLTMVNHTSLHIAKYPVGIESRIQDVYQHLSIGRNDITCMIGIVGTGGIGKTTISKKIYNRISSQFEGSCLLKDVRETSKQRSGLIQLQNRLLYEILRESLDVRDIDIGVNVIRHRLRSKRVLLILDDVDELVQLENLAGDRNWFGLGSRIIITTRDRHLLNNPKADSVYEVKILDYNEALRLFSWHAFEKEEPIENYVKISKQVLQYAQGLPLVLTILGSDLKGRSLHQWKSALGKYRKTPHGNIQKVLQTSYDGLDNNEKDMFLDIAFFFKGELLANVIKIFDSCGFSPDDGINRLIEKCLITVDNDTLRMHDVLQDMGREIVRLQSPKELGKRSRLWFHEDVRHVLEESTGTNKVEGMVIDLPASEDMINLGPDAFVSMKRLRVFINRNACFSEGPNYLSNELRVLDWVEYPMQSLPPNFNGKKLILFRMRDSLIMELGQKFKNLKTLDLSYCNFLTKIPDLSSASNLEELRVEYCASLVEVHDSVGFLDNLSSLSFEECPNLSIFPKSLKLRSLHMLNLNWCTSFRNFPEIEGKMENLRILYVEGIAIEELPLSIGNLVGLYLLNLRSCKKLTRLPTCILQLQNLRDLYISVFQNILNFGKIGDNKQSLLAIDSTTMEDEIISSCEEQLHELQPPANSSNGSTTLQVLNLPNCLQSESNFFPLSNFFTMFNSKAILYHLDLSKSTIVSLPTSIKGFVKLALLNLSHCKKLEEIPELPPNIKEVRAWRCNSLKRFPEVSKILQFYRSDIRSLALINLTGCDKMHVNIWNRHGPNPLLRKGYYHKVSSDSSRFTMPYDVQLSVTKAIWVIDIEGPHFLENISGIALYCVVFFKHDDWFWDQIRAEITCDVSNHVCNIERGVLLLKLDIHSMPYKVWVAYSSIESFKLKVLDNLIVHFYIKNDHRGKFYKSCGANVVYKDERRAKEEKETRMEPVVNNDGQFQRKMEPIFRICDSLIMEFGQRFMNLTTMDLSYCNFLTKIPDLSSASNLEELRVEYCASLVEVNDSIGFLDNLSSLSFEECPNLSIFPRSLKLRSLHVLNLNWCTSFRNFPEIEGKMENLRILYVEGTAIEELPLSIGNLVGLYELNLRSCKNLTRLPTCILQLQNLSNLSISVFQNILNFGKMGDNKQSLLAIDSTTMEDEIISSSEEQPHELQTPANSSNGSTALQVLNLPNCSQSESNFFSLSNFFTMFNFKAILYHLDLSKSTIVSLPTSIKGFAKLALLDLSHCMKLEEIPELPPNIKEVHAWRCKSLERFPEVSKILQFYRSDIISLALINLTGCDKMHVNIWNHDGPNPLLQKGRYHKVSSDGGHFTRPDDVQLSGTKAICVIDIDGPHYLENISGIALYCVVFFKEDDWFWDQIRAEITCDVSNHVCNIERGVLLLKLDIHSSPYKVWVAYSSIESFKLKVLDNLRVHFYIENDHRGEFYKSCGANVVYKHERRAKEEKETRM